MRKNLLATLFIIGLCSAIFSAVYLMRSRNPQNPSPRSTATCVVRTYINGSEVVGAYVRASFPRSIMGGYDRLPDQRGESPLTVTFDYGKGFHVRAFYGGNRLNYTGYKWVTWFSSNPDSGEIVITLAPFDATKG